MSQSKYKGMKTINLLRYYSITFLFVVYVSQLYSLDCSNYRFWPNGL